MYEINQTEEARWRYYLSLFVLFFVAAVLMMRLSFVFMADPKRFPVQHVKILASYEHVSQKKLYEVFVNYANHSFYTLPVAELQSKLMSISWVKSVRIKRIWPDTITIAVHEFVPAAIWNKEFMTADGELFDGNGDIEKSSLLHLSGPENQQREVLQVYEKLSTILASYNLHAASLTLHDNQAWDIILTNGIYLRLGKKELLNRLTRFCKAFSAVFADKPLALAMVDLRYPRGMAIHWKQVT